MNENEKNLLRSLLVDLFLASPRKTTTTGRYDDRGRSPDIASIDIKGQSSNGPEKESPDGSSQESKKGIHSRGVV